MLVRTFLQGEGTVLCTMRCSPPLVPVLVKFKMDHLKTKVLMVQDKSSCLGRNVQYYFDMQERFLMLLLFTTALNLIYPRTHLRICRKFYSSQRNKIELLRSSSHLTVKSTMSDNGIIIVRGGRDIATGTICYLYNKKTAPLS